MTEFKPIPDPAGSLEPPRRYPPTAVGAATPPEPPRRPVTARAKARPSKLALALQLALILPLLGAKVAVRAAKKLVAH